MINYQLQGFGFKNITDYLSSTFNPKLFTGVGLVLGGGVGILSTFLENYIGVKPVVYVAFMLLLLGEFVSGIIASKKHGQKIQSRKFGRMIIKIGSYTTILGILHAFETGLEVPHIFGVDINIYEWIYYAVLNMIVIQLLISVFENLDRMGLTETNLILKVLKKKLGKWFLDEDVREFE